jgi:nitrate reductase delta subunit
MVPADISLSLRLLARLLTYPDAALRGDLADLRATLAAGVSMPAARRTELDALAATLENGDPIENEAEYVRTFDQGRSTSLHLFEHVHGDSRDRGPAMIDLIQTYEQAGLHLAPGELPDYLPAVLEFASPQPPREARAFLGEIAHVVKAIHGALRQRKSAYACVLATLLELSGEAPATTTNMPVTPDESLDASWEEPPAFGGCSTKGQAGGQGVQPVHFVGTGAPARKTTVSASTGAIR